MSDDGRNRRWCKRCDQVREFTSRERVSHQTGNAYTQFDCVACARRRGRERSPEKISWKCMKDRCLNPGAENYKYYGGRGVSICPEWVDSFDAFLADVGPRPRGMTLDRIDPFGDYEPGNVRWASQKDQIENRRVTYRKKRKDYPSAREAKTKGRSPRERYKRRRRR